MTRMTIAGSPLLIIALLLLPLSVARAEVNGACLSDAKAQCPGIQAGGGKIRECLKTHLKDLSEPCQTVLLKAVTAKACVDDVKQLCAGVAPGEGRVEACMKSHIADISNACKLALAAAAAGED